MIEVPVWSDRGSTGSQECCATELKRRVSEVPTKFPLFRFYKQHKQILNPLYLPSFKCISSGDINKASIVYSINWVSMYICMLHRHYIYFPLLHNTFLEYWNFILKGNSFLTLWDNDTIVCLGSLRTIFFIFCQCFRQNLRTSSSDSVSSFFKLDSFQTEAIHQFRQYCSC